MRLRLLTAAAAAALVTILPAAVADAAVVPGKVIVRYADGADRHERVDALRSTGTSTDELLPGGARELEIEDGDSVGATVDELEDDPAVAYAVPDYVVTKAAFVPNDPGRLGVAGGWQELQWNFTGPFGVNAPDAWELASGAGAPGGRGAVVAVIDSGVAYASNGRFRRAPDLAGSRFARGYDWVDDDRRPNDEESHGTHVTGTIAQTTDNGRGVTGLAYGAKIMPLRVLDHNGNGAGSDIARAVRYAARHRADVINMSVEFDSRQRARDIPEVIRAIRYAARKGVVMVAASGNEGNSSKVAYPARAGRVISVGATTVRGCLADYSNGGSGLDLVAPGGGADAPLDGSEWDLTHCNGAGLDRRIVQQTLRGGVRRFALAGFEGTSFAAPHVSATAALLIATRRLGSDPSPAAVRRRIVATALDAGAPGHDSDYGAGIVDAAAALAPAP